MAGKGRSQLRPLWVLFVFGMVSLCGWAGEPPAIEHLFPAGFTRGTTTQVTLAGKFDPWPPSVWVSCPGVMLTAETNKGRFQVEVCSEAPLGPHLMRFYNEDGASLPRIFVVSDKEELLENEPNDRFVEPQPAWSLPITINGYLQKAGDVDSFALLLQAGQWLEARLDSYTLASRVDALLRVVTAVDGAQQTWNHDFISLDPRISWQAPSNGIYVLQVMGFRYPADAQVRFTGGAGCVYRLHLDVLAKPPELICGGVEETEPNNSITNAPVLRLPASVRGAIQTAGDEDCYGFSADKGETLEFVVEAADLGSPLDAYLKITDPAGKELARNDDAGRLRDPRLEWKAPEKATFYAHVGNLLRSSGPGHGYRLAINRVQPEYTAALAASSASVTVGETNEIKLTVTRLRGFDGKLKASIQGLPQGTHAEPVDVPDKSGPVTLNLIADPDARPAQLPVRVVLTETASSQERAALFSLTGTSEDNGVPGGYTHLLVESIDHLWLTVKTKPAPPEKEK